jgi:hypothetical protein
MTLHPPRDQSLQDHRGDPKTRLEHVYAATALNLIRLHAWRAGHPLDRTRTSHLARLELPLAA